MCRFGTEPAADAARTRSEGGYALLLALLALVGLTALATAGFLRADTDWRVSQNHDATVQAFYAADAGLRTFMATHRGPPTDTVTYQFESGTATVFASPINHPDDIGRMYLVTSRGTHMPPGGGIAVRTVSSVALTSTMTLEVPGALVSGVGIQKNGTAGELNGYDKATSADCPVGGQGDKAGVAVPPDGYQQSGGGGQQAEEKDLVPEGNPPIYEDDPITLLESTRIDWEGIVNGTALTPDYFIPGDGSPGADWPDFDQLPADYWPVIYVDETWLELNPDYSGRGTLIVRGNLTMNGNFQWNGIILTGGAITSDGNQTVMGGTITGLNLLLGEEVSATNLGNGTKTFRYHSCHAWEAMSRLAMLSPQPGSWFETL